MRVADLIETLKQFDPDLPVLIEGYEGGCDDVSTVEQIQVIRDQNEEWYYGKHEKVEDLHESVLEELSDDGKLPSIALLIK